MIRYTYIILLLLLISSCEDPISVDVPSSGESKLVVEGVITDQMSIQEIQLSMTNDFLNPASSPKISDGIVQVVDNSGHVFNFLESSTPGTYLSNRPFQGEENAQYKLHFSLNDGRSFESDFQELKPVPEIRLSSTKSLSPNTDDYIVNLETSDNPQSEDFYRWKIYKNGQTLGTLADVFLRSDRLFNGNRFDVDFDTFLFEKGDSCSVEQFSLTENAFGFFRLIQIQAGNKGESTSTAPTQVVGNVKNINDFEEEVLGFFYATGVSSASIVIE